MSNHPTRRRLRALALATAGLTAAGITLAPTQSQAAERTPGTSKSAPPSLDKTKYAMDDGLYIVVLNQPGSTGYAGGVKGIPATRATGDRPFASHSDAARRYSNYLRSEQNQLAQSVGASIDRHYTTAANGFGARLTGEQAMALATNKDVALVEKSRTYTVDTWNTPEFLGLSGKNGVWNTKFGGAKKAGDGVVVGVIDTGIWPESKSFKGRPLGESPDGTWDLSMDADGYT
ncbi:MAG: S8 family serine peptidase, partial [Nocardioides sp.]